jgi:hypothetical protein
MTVNILNRAEPCGLLGAAQVRRRRLNGHRGDI